MDEGKFTQSLLASGYTRTEDGTLEPPKDKGILPSYPEGALRIQNEIAELPDVFDADFVLYLYDNTKLEVTVPKFDKNAKMPERLGQLNAAIKKMKGDKYDPDGHRIYETNLVLPESRIEVKI